MPAEHAEVMRELAKFYQNLLGSIVDLSPQGDKFIPQLILHLGKSRHDVIKFVQKYLDDGYNGGIIDSSYDPLENFDTESIFAWISHGFAYCNNICSTIFVTVQDDLNYITHWVRLWADPLKLIFPDVYMYNTDFRIKINVFPTGILIAIRLSPPGDVSIEI